MVDGTSIIEEMTPMNLQLKNDKKTYLFLFICLFNLYFAQKTISFDFIATYRLTSKKSSQSQSKQQENFFLFLNEKESFFLSEKDLGRDTINFRASGEVDIAKLMSYRTYFSDRVYTTTENHPQLSILKYNNDFFEYANNEFKQSWKINNEKKAIKNSPCTTATINAFGRDWEACFSQEYPFPFGPYKFNNLPGLIISVKDSEGLYDFELIGFSKKKFDYKIEKVKKTVSKEEYYKVLKELHFSSKIFDNMSTPDDPSSINRMRKAHQNLLKSIDNYPIDKDMRYIFD